MTGKPPFIIDAGPALNFLASGSERVLSDDADNPALHHKPWRPSAARRLARPALLLTG